MLMTGESRTAFHAVPCILTKPVKTAPADIGTCPLVTSGDFNRADPNICKSLDHNHYWKDEMNDASWEDFSKYISQTRININIRQVHKYKED